VSVRGPIPGGEVFKLVTKVVKVTLREWVGRDFTNDWEEVIERTDRRQGWKRWIAEQTAHRSQQQRCFHDFECDLSVVKVAGQADIGRARLRWCLRQAEVELEKGLEITRLVVLHGDLRYCGARTRWRSLNRATMVCGVLSIPTRSREL
jgi:hypothetical protein